MILSRHGSEIQGCDSVGPRINQRKSRLTLTLTALHLNSKFSSLNFLDVLIFHFFFSPSWSITSHSALGLFETSHYYYPDGIKVASVKASLNWGTRYHTVIFINLVGSIIGSNVLTFSINSFSNFKDQLLIIGQMIIWWLFSIHRWSPLLTNTCWGWEAKFCCFLFSRGPKHFRWWSFTSSTQSGLGNGKRKRWVRNILGMISSLWRLMIDRCEGDLLGIGWGLQKIFRNC